MGTGFVVTQSLYRLMVVVFVKNNMSDFHYVIHITPVVTIKELGRIVSAVSFFGPLKNIMNTQVQLTYRNIHQKHNISHEDKRHFLDNDFR